MRATSSKQSCPGITGLSSPIMTMVFTTLCHSVSTVMQYYSPYSNIIPHVHSCMQCLSHCEENHSTSVALLDANKKYNRFLNIVPCECEPCFSLLCFILHGIWVMMRCYMHLICTDDDNRVKLKSLSGREDCQHDYINASYVDVSIPLTMYTRTLTGYTCTCMKMQVQMYIYTCPGCCSTQICMAREFVCLHFMSLSFLQGYGIARKFVVTQGQ